MNIFTPAEGTNNYGNAGVAKSKLNIAVMIVSGMMAGFLIGVAAAVTQMAGYALDNNSVIRILSGVLFGFGLGGVVCTGFELFTGNTLMIISVLDKRINVAQMLKNWIFVYIGNFLGSMVFAFMVARFNWMGAGEGALANFCMKVATAKMSMPFQNAFVMGILCNMLVTIGVFVSLAGKDGVSRMMGAWFPVMFFVLCGFNHSIADMTYCMMGLFAKAPFAQFAGDYANLTWGHYITGNLIPVTLGNTVGGVLVGAFFWFAYLKKR